MALQNKNDIFEEKNTLKQHLDFYIKFGFSPIPVRNESKAINLQTWDFNKPTHDYVNQWIQENRFQNIGLLVGEPSNNLAVIDIDKTNWISLEFLKTLLKNDSVITNQIETIGFLIKTHRGYQIWLKQKPGLNENNETINDFGIELFVEKHMIVAPPSIHPLGTQYKFLVQPTNFKPVNVNEFWNKIKIHCMENDPDIALKQIRISTKRKEIMDHLHNPECEHLPRVWVVGFLYTVAKLEEKEILDFIEKNQHWSDYNFRKTASLVHSQIQYIDRKVGEKGGEGA